jgi:diaminopimelate epimerase
MFFWKMSGAGNDFIIINNIRERIPAERFPAIARRLCERHLSIGADGIMVVEKAESPAADIRALIFNADGSEAEMCGNGVRCIARYAYEEKLTAGPARIEAKAGLTAVERLSKRTYKVQLQRASLVKTGGTAVADGREYPYVYVELGNPGIPHAVVPFAGLRDADRNALRIIGRALRFHGDFPKGANVNFYEIVDCRTVELLTYERGVEDFTYACGTGAGASALALRLRNLVSAGTLNLRVPGGLLQVELSGGGAAAADYGIYLIGDTNVIYTGEALDEDFTV